MPAEKESSTGPVRHKIAHAAVISGNGRPYAQPFKKNPDVFDGLIRPSRGVLAPDFYQVRTDPAHMHGYDTADIIYGLNIL
jgi:hypothetical protein